MNKFIIAGNWKLNGNNILISNFIKKLKMFFKTHSIINTIIFIPPIVYINNIKDIIQEKNFFLGAQNVDLNLSGAFTGEISVNMIKDIGVKYVIIGHSERRILHYENNKCIAQKFKILKSKKIIPILCLGENLKEKNFNKSELICRKQIDEIITIVGKNAFQNSIIAYEPIWAIGTGQAADLKYIIKMHKFIKTYISENSNINIHDVIVQYGGSVNENNIEQFFNTNDINGVLLGNSALIYEKFTKIIKITNKLRY